MLLSSSFKYPVVARFALACLAAASTLTLFAGCAMTPEERAKKAVTSMAFSPDQAQLAYATAHEIRVLQTGSWKHVRTLRALPESTEGADPLLFRHGVGDNLLFLDDTRIASTGMGGLVTVWDVSTGERLSTIGQASEERFASTIDYSAATRRLLVGTSTGEILLTTLKDNEAALLEPVADSVGYVWDLQFSRDGHYFASASLMPGKAPEEAPDDDWTRMQLDETSDDITYAQISTSPPPSNVLIWDARNLEMLGELKGARNVLRMALVPGQQALLTVGSKVAVWEFLTREQFEEVSDPSMALQSIGVGTLVVISVAGMAMGAMPGMSFGDSLVALAHFPVVPTATSLQHGCARAGAISPDGQTIVSTTRGPSHNVMAVIDRKTNKVLDKWSADSLTCEMQFSQDGKHLAVASPNGLLLYDTTSWKKTDLTRIQQQTIAD